MALIARCAKPRSMTLAARQLALAWITGSVIMGTVAVLFLAFPVRAFVVPLPGPARLALPLSPGASPRLVPPFSGLPLGARLGVAALAGLLFLALGVLAARTGKASWLPDGPRGCVWWALITGAVGLTGWGFAASVTFAASFGPVWQGVLAYTAGGLPFALAAALLQSSGLANVAAAVACAALLVTGFVLVAVRLNGGPNALVLSLDYLRYLLSATPRPVPGGPVILY
jgi:hypothetical protein